MTESIISQALLDTIRRTCYEAGQAGREVYTCRSVSEEVVRCWDCAWFHENATPLDKEYPDFCHKNGIDLKDGNGFCAWGERR